MQFAQIVISDEQAGALATVTDLVIQEAEKLGIVWDEESDELGNVQRLAAFMADVSENPRRYPVTGAMARSIKAAVKRAVGPAATPARKHKRKDRQQRRQSGQKFLRQQRREQAAQFNEARERIEAEMAEAQAAHEAMLAEFAEQPTFDIIGPEGQPILKGVPESFIVRTTHTVADEPAEQTAELILPAGVEREAA